MIIVSHGSTDGHPCGSNSVPTTPTASGSRPTMRPQRSQNRRILNRAAACYRQMTATANRIFVRFQYARLPLHIANPQLPLLEQLEDTLRRAPTATAAVAVKIPHTTPFCQAVQSIESAFYHLDRPYQLNIFVRHPATTPTALQARCWVAENPLTRALLTFTLLEPATDGLPIPNSPPPPPPSGFWQRLPDTDIIEQNLPTGEIPAFSHRLM